MGFSQYHHADSRSDHYPEIGQQLNRAAWDYEGPWICEQSWGKLMTKIDESHNSSLLSPGSLLEKSFVCLTSRLMK